MTRTPEKLGSLRARTASRAWCPRTNSADGARRFANTAAANRAGPAETRATAAEEPPADENTPEAATRAATAHTSPNPAVVCARARACVSSRGRKERAAARRATAASASPAAAHCAGCCRSNAARRGLIVAAVASGRATRVHVRAPRVHGRAPRVVGLDAATLASARRAVLGKGRGRGRGRGWGSGCVTDRGESGRSARLEGWRVVGGGGRIAGERRAHAVDRGRTYPSARRRLRSARTSRVSARRDARGEPRALTREASRTVSGATKGVRSGSRGRGGVACAEYARCSSTRLRERRARGPRATRRDV